MYFDQLLFLLPFTQMSDTEYSLADTENEPPQLETLQAGPSLQISSAKKQWKINYDEEILKVLKKASERQTKVDEDESFLLSLLPAFKKYEEEQKFMLRIEVMNTILSFSRSQYV